MSPKESIRLMADYNQAMNNTLYDVVSLLPPEQYTEDLGAFFGSIIGTLNHIVVADTIWLKRFSQSLNHPELSPIREMMQPTSLKTILFAQLAELKTRRRLLDELIIHFVAALTDEELQKTIRYKNMKGETCNKNLFALLLHFFNHQTHHRGQITTLLSQLGANIGVTDLVAYMPDCESV